MVAIQVGTALLGACVGSFLNVVIHRLPQAQPAARSLLGRSKCPKCGVQIQARDNVPLLGWLLLAGKARCCGAKISPRYPLVELLTAALFWLVACCGARPFPLQLHELGFVVGSAAEIASAVLSLTFVALLIAASCIDLDHRILPDALTKPGMALFLLAGLWPGLTEPISGDANVPLALRHFLGAFAGLLTGVASTLLVRWLGSWAFRQEAMGLGDVKFLGMIGAFLGWQGALLTLLLGCVIGAIAGGIAALRGGLRAQIPFGPFLAAGALIAMVAGDSLLHAMFVTWPNWQHDHPASHSLLLLTAALSLLLLLWLVHRGRRQS